MPRTQKNIYKRKDGRWEARYPCGKTSDGKTKYKSIYAKSYKEVKELLAHSLYYQNKSNYKKILFSSVLDSWMKLRSVQQKASTKLKYEYLIEEHIKPELGGYDVKDVSEVVINTFLESKMKGGRLDHGGGLSNSYVTSMFLIIRSSLKYASDQELCRQLKSPVFKPTNQTKEIAILKVEEQKFLEEKLMTDESLESLGIIIALNTGLRIGELCALKWSDIDFDSKIIHVRHTVVRVKNLDSNINQKTILILDRPKTFTSSRDIPITTKLFPVLAKAMSVSQSDFVVSSTNSFISPRTFEYRYHKKLEEYGIAQINFHALRHSFATRCIEKGVDIKTLSEILGHSNVSITLNTYVHSSMDLKRKQLEKLI